MTSKMKIPLFYLWLLLLLAGSAWGEEQNPVVVDVLTRTALSWDGRALPAYAEGRPEITILRIKIPLGRNCPCINTRSSMPVYCCRAN